MSNETFMGEPVLTRWKPLNRDDSRLALWQSMHKREFGNSGDDKLMLEWLWENGYALCKRAPDQGLNRRAPQPDVEIERLQLCEQRLAAVTRWLEANQPDVFKRGIWDAVTAAKVSA